MARRIQANAKIGSLDLTSIQEKRVQIPDVDGRLTHLQFRRFAGCPICNLHLRTMVRRLDEIERAGIREVAVFHSSREAMLPYQGDLPMDVIADPKKVLYAQFGVEESVLGTLDPRTLCAGVRGLFVKHPRHLTKGDEGGHFGMPADFLIGPTGMVLAAKYGTHADDQWSVDELLEVARSVESLKVA